MKIQPILLEHFKRNGLTIYKSKNKVKLERTSSNDISPTIGEVLSVSMRTFRVDAFIDGKIQSILLGVGKYVETYVDNPDEALKLVGINDTAKAKILSWKRSLNWKKADPVEKDWNFEVEAYEYSLYDTWNVEIFIPSENILSVETYFGDVVITFKDLEGYIQTITDEIER